MSDVPMYRRPIAWVYSAIASVLAVFGFLAQDPTGTMAAIFSVAIADATSLFTALSILGFTVAPETGLPEVTIQRIALLFGLIVVAKILNDVIDSITDRIGD